MFNKNRIILIVTFFMISLSFSQEKDKRYLSDVRGAILKFQIDSKKYWETNDRENALKYKDSIKSILIGAFVEPIEFKTLDKAVFKIGQKKRPTFIQITASWCAPCRAEIPALNKIVEKYSDKVDFVLLFWDMQYDVSKLANQYDKRIVLVPSDEREVTRGSIYISGFKHDLGFPSNYLVSVNNRIINFSRGAAAPISFTDEKGKEIVITKEDAFNKNYKKLDSEIKDLLEKSIVN